MIIRKKRKLRGPTDNCPHWRWRLPGTDACGWPPCSRAHSRYNRFHGSPCGASTYKRSRAWWMGALCCREARAGRSDRIQVSMEGSSSASGTEQWIPLLGSDRSSAPSRASDIFRFHTFSDSPTASLAPASASSIASRTASSPNPRRLKKA